MADGDPAPRWSTEPVQTRRERPRQAGGAAAQSARDGRLLRDVQSVWRQAVGDAVAAEAVPYSERDGRLVVLCSSPIWTAELDLRASVVLQLLNQQLDDPARGAPGSPNRRLLTRIVTRTRTPPNKQPSVPLARESLGPPSAIRPSPDYPTRPGSLDAPRGGHPRVRAIVDAVVEIKLPSFEPLESLLRMVVHYAAGEPQLLVSISDTLYTQIFGTPRNGGAADLAKLRGCLVGRHISFRAVPARTRSTKPIFIAGQLHLDREPGLPVPYGPAFPPGEWVYFVGPPDRQTVKIGTTYTLYERLIEQLQPQSVVPLVLYAIRPGYRPEERAFHDRFAAYRSRGEIFNVTGDLARWLDDEGLPQPLNLLTPGQDISLDQNPPDLTLQLQRTRAHTNRPNTTGAVDE